MLSARSVLAATAFGLLGASTTLAQAQTPPPDACVGAPWDAFDFWVGTWNVYGPANGETPGPYLGHNVIERVNGGCLVTEHWVSATGNPGDSLNVFDPLLGEWRQVWMSNGWYIDYTGGLDDNGAMVLTGEAYTVQTATRAPLRGTWTPNADGTVTQQFDQGDGSGNWTTIFVGIYVPKAADPRAAEAAAARGE
ncbi:hypothetical protein [Maricaulis sp.]|uniref:hypothetical protein n=1 Tax=Maricaulis sp. TaxID=1486257 RepID=UPI0025BD0347|nr:hypothetical protein [Maricaulis sp.]